MLRCLSTASIVGTLAVLRAHLDRPRPETVEERRRALGRLIRTLSAIAWPPVLLSLVDPCDRSCAALVPALAYPLVAWAVDERLRRAPPRPDAGVACLKFEPASVTAVTFGLCGLAGARADSRYTPLFLYAVLACVLVVLPANTADPASEEAVVLEHVQRSALVWCIGLLTAAVALTRVCPPTARP